MNFIYVLNGKKLKQYFFITVAILFAFGVIYSERSNITVFSSQEPNAVYNVVTNKKVIALTFDISWGEKRTVPILEVLKQNDVPKATFFLSSLWSQSHPDIVKKIVDGGFEIGSHGHKHVNYSELNDEDIRKQLTLAHQTISTIAGKTPKLLRLPNGDFDKRVLNIAGSLGYTVIQWDTDSMDWMSPGVDKIVKRVVTNAHPGDIVLLHASDSSKQTHEALPQIIKQLRNQGYEFVTVSELLSMTELQDKEVQDKAPAGAQ